MKVWNEITFKPKPIPQDPMKVPQNEDPSACTGNLKSKSQHSPHSCEQNSKLLLCKMTNIYD